MWSSFLTGFIAKFPRFPGFIYICWRSSSRAPQKKNTVFLETTQFFIYEKTMKDCLTFPSLVIVWKYARGAVAPDRLWVGNGQNKIPFWGFLFFSILINTKEMNLVRFYATNHYGYHSAIFHFLQRPKGCRSILQELSPLPFNNLFDALLPH